MAESAADNVSEVVRATPPTSAGDTENNGVDTDTVSLLIYTVVYTYLCITADGF